MTIFILTFQHFKSCKASFNVAILKYINFIIYEAFTFVLINDRISLIKRKVGEKIMALLKLEDIKKLLDENKIDLKDLEKLNALEEIKKKNEKIIGLLDKFKELVNSKKLLATEVDKMLDDITKILNDKLPKRKAKTKSKSASKKDEEKIEITDEKVEEKVENVENHNQNENA